MAVVWQPNSRAAHLAVQFEQHPTSVVAVDHNGEAIKIGNPYQFREFPKMLYRAREQGGIYECVTAEPDPLAYEKPDQYQRAQDRWHRDMQAATLTVGSADEERRAFEQGFRNTPDAAIQLLKDRETARARAQAEAQWAVNRMSEKAQQEFAAKDASTGDFVSDVTSADVKRGPGRPRKEA